jgi:hypothetical protein
MRPPKPFQLANEVRLKRSQFSGVFLLVEGPTDSRFYRRFVNSAACRLVVCFQKANVLEAIDILENDGFLGVLGLVDADFDILDGKTQPSSNVITCDCHDLDSMLIRSSALETVLHEHASIEKWIEFERRFGGTIRDWLLATARCLGYLRWSSLRRNWNLTFEGLHFGRFMNPRDLSLDPIALRREVRNISQAHLLREQELSDAGWPREQGHDPWQLCCGPDMVELLTFALRRGVGSCRELTPQLTARALRLAFSEEQFAGLELSAALRSWESAKGCKILP